MCVHVCVCTDTHSITFDFLQPPQQGAFQAPLSMGFPRQECWSELPGKSHGQWSLEGSMLRGLQEVERDGVCVRAHTHPDVLGTVLLCLRWEKVVIG